MLTLTEHSKLSFSGFLHFNGNPARGQNDSKSRDGAPSIFGSNSYDNNLFLREMVLRALTCLSVIKIIF